MLKKAARGELKNETRGGLKKRDDPRSSGSRPFFHLLFTPFFTQFFNQVLNQVFTGPGGGRFSRPRAGPCDFQPLCESLGWHGVRSLQGLNCRLPPIVRERVRAPSRRLLLVKQPRRRQQQGHVNV